MPAVGADVISVAVALVGVAGTLGATLLGHRATERDKRLDAEIQRGERSEERQEAARVAALVDKRATYADLNAAARLYRTVGHDYLMDRMRGTEQHSLDDLETARTNYRDQYARAQMILPERALTVASEVNLCLGHGYRVLREIDAGSRDEATVRSLHEWFDGPMSDGVWLLRRVLREDLGVVEPSTDTRAAAQRLRAARIARFDHESAQVTPSDQAGTDSAG